MEKKNTKLQREPDDMDIERGVRTQAVRGLVIDVLFTRDIVPQLRADHALAPVATVQRDRPYVCRY